MPRTMYVKADATQLVEEEGEKPKHALLWGDPVTEVVDAADGEHVVGIGHGHRGLVPMKDLQDDELRLLEIYVIDVGQGDAILFRTPDGKWHLMDGGPPRTRSLLGEGARNFLAWKFGRDLGLKDSVPLQTVILSHSDEDHFAGLTEIFDNEFPPDPKTGINELVTTVEHFLHAGVAKYAGAAKLGVVGDRIPADRLLDDRDDFIRPPFPLAPQFGCFAEALSRVRTADGEMPKVRRVAFGATVPGYGPDEGAGLCMHILGPVPENPAGDLRKLGDRSHTVNGHSVVVRLDYEDVRILLTGDINEVAQRHLMADGRAAEFKADVIKACHHGSEDVDSDFTKCVAPRVTVVSSGDNEGHSHPRPAALGGYAYYGRRSFSAENCREGSEQPPLVYATEIARSISTDDVVVNGRRVTTVDGVVFGLVNVRTDGKKVVCAVRNETEDAFEVEVLWVGADDEPPHDRDG